MSEEESEIYASRLQELEVKLRFCRHHLGDKMATDTLLAMRGNEALGDKLDVSTRKYCYIMFCYWKICTFKYFYEHVDIFHILTRFNRNVFHKCIK